MKGGAQALAMVGLLVALACAREPTPIPDPDVSGMEAAVRERLEEARQAVTNQPDSAEAWGELGMVLHVHGLHGAAADAYREARRLAPGEVRWSYYLGDAASILGVDLEEAAEAFRSVIERRPDYAPVYFRLGDVLAQQEALEAAASAYTHALELAPELGPAVLGLGQVRLRQGRVDEAVSLLERAVELLPHSSPALFALGRAYQRAAREEEAREVAERARSVDGVDFFPDPLMQEVLSQAASSSLLWERARSNLERGEPSQALPDLERVAAARPEDAGVQQQLGEVYAQLGQRSRAIEHLDRSLSLGQDPRPGVRGRLAVLLLEEGRAAEAAAQLRVAIEARPEDGELRGLLGRALVEGGELDAAIESFAEAAVRGPVPGWIHNEWGSALARQARYAEAIGHFREALREDPSSAQALFNLGLALEVTGRREDAIAAYRRVMAIEPNPLAASRLAALGAR